MTVPHGLRRLALRALRALPALLALALPLACTTAAAGGDPKAMHLMLQVCLPDKKAFFDELNVDVTDIPANISFPEFGQLFKDAKAGGKEFKNPYKSASEARQYEPMRMWRASAGDLQWPYIDMRRTATGSDTSGTGYLVDSTETDQPVFDDFFTLERPGDVIAIRVVLRRPRDGQTDLVTYWFKPPKDISPGGYTPWLAPVSEEGPNDKSPGQPTFWLLMNGKDMPTHPVGENAPRVRYMLMNYETWLPLDKARLRALRAVQLQRVIDGLPVGSGAFRLAPAKGARVLSC